MDVASVASSQAGIPLRVSVFLNGDAAQGGAGRRVVLDRAESLAENLQRIAHKLRLDPRRCPQPCLYTRRGVRLSDVEEIIEGEVLYFEPRGAPFAIPERSIGSTAGNSVPAPKGNSSFKSNRSVASGRSSVRSRKQATPRSATNAISPRDLVRSNSFEFDYLMKFILVGSTAVGKSCLLMRFTSDRFNPSHEATVGVDFGSEIISIRDRRIKTQVWDTAGQEYFRSITKSYFREAAAAIIVFDFTNRGSFDDLHLWLENVRSSSTNRQLVITLVGNKSDKPLNEQRITVEEAEKFARENGLIFVQASALSGAGVSEAFTRTADAVLRKVDAGLIDTSDSANGVRRGEFQSATVASDVSSTSRSLYPINVGGNRIGAEEDDSCYC